jgi:putative oxidoreductase
MHALVSNANPVLNGLNGLDQWLPQLAVRALLAYEFWESGTTKLRGENWFADIQGDFPFPFNFIPVGVSWLLATWSELLGAMGLLLGLASRFWAFALIILDLVAWYSVHAGNGYNVCDNGFKLSLMYLVLLLVPLFRSDPG